MITLAIDTSTVQGAVALLDDDRPIAEEHFGRDGLFDAILRLHLDRFDRLVVGVGPGSFTGIRAGLAAAKGLALPRSVPICAVSSFAALALTALPQLPDQCRQICVIGDARRGEIYFARYDRTGQPVGECRIGTVESLAGELREPTWFVSAEIGRYAEVLRPLGVVCDQPIFPSATILGRLGQPPTHRLPLEPIYLRAVEYRLLPQQKT